MWTDPAAPSTSAQRVKPTLVSAYVGTRTTSSCRFTWCSTISLLIVGTGRRSQQQPAAVDREIHAVDRGILEQEQRRVDDVARLDVAPRRGVGAHVLEHRLLAAPVVGVAHDPGMDGVDADR